MNPTTPKRELAQLGPILTTKRRRIGVARDVANEVPVAEIQQPTSSRSPSRTLSDREQELAITVVAASNATATSNTTLNTPVESADLHAGKPEACDRPIAFADKRAQIANALPLTNNHQGCLHTAKNTLLGMVIDGADSPRELITDSVIVTTIGGGGEFDVASGRMLRTKDQDEACQKYKSAMDAFERRLPVSVVIGSKNKSYPVKPPRSYCLMGFFLATYVWAEKTVTVDGSSVSEYMIRLEKIDPQVKSWWMPAGHDTEPVPVGEFQCDGNSCDSCGKYSKTVYTEGWACLSMSCPEHFKFERPVSPDELIYNEVFLLERHDNRDLLPLPQAVPALPVANQMSYGTEAEFKRGIVCPQCGFCSRRVYWWGWACENESVGCDFKHIVSFTNYPLSSVEKECTSMNARRRLEIIDKSIQHKTISGGGYTIEMYSFPNSEGTVGGAVAVFRATPETCGMPNGPDNLYLDMQNADLRLQRNPARNKGSRREELTSHFAYNYGAFYKFGVFVESVGFKDAPAPILAGLAQLDWAQSLGITHLSEFVRGLSTGHSDTSMSLKSEKFNELLALGYFEGSTISYHDDGEKELGPTVATLSLGSPAVMRFRPKRKTQLGQEGKGKKGNKRSVLSFFLNHGDIVIMHGTDIHREYEHEVTPCGKLRFALTARFVRPESIENLEERQRAVENGQVPEGIENMAYKGHEEAAGEPEANA
ncbi:oxoglutarate iron-dependent oxygenase protein [Apiospora rasikravindrae]|uniref:Oxoglutarate iron-dependent oxygenase protein n=1 Tax=Apiospora rasikravindrae TaxID=990691 RepID=A0ABR1S1K9_9PEZI